MKGLTASVEGTRGGAAKSRSDRIEAESVLETLRGAVEWLAAGDVTTPMEDGELAEAVRIVEAAVEDTIPLRRKEALERGRAHLCYLEFLSQVGGCEYDAIRGGYTMALAMVYGDMPQQIELELEEA